MSHCRQNLYQFSLDAATVLYSFRKRKITQRYTECNRILQRCFLFHQWEIFLLECSTSSYECITHNPKCLISRRYPCLFSVFPTVTTYSCKHITETCACYNIKESLYPLTQLLFPLV